MKKYLCCKFKEVVVTHSSKEYQGSITIDEYLMEVAGLKEYQAVEVNNHNGNRDRTYVLKGQRFSGIIAINGALSARHKKGDKIHILAYKYSLFRVKPILVETSFLMSCNLLK